MGVYGASELYMINDCSPGFTDTWAQVDRRIEDALKLGRAAGDPASAAGAAAAAAGAVLQQLASLISPGGKQAAR